MFKEILVYVGTGETARRISEYATEFAAVLDAKLTGFVVDVDSVDYTEFEAAMSNEGRESAIKHLLAERARHHTEALRVGSLFETAARQRNLLGGMRYVTSVEADISTSISAAARLFDCVIVPAKGSPGELTSTLVEDVLFGSGRPLVLLPTDREIVCALGHIAVAWDGGKAATRALHDALPVLAQATAVDVLTITDEKSLDRLPPGRDLAMHLESHGIIVRYGEIRFGRKAVGDQIMDEAVRRGAGLLVMGAYGHSRLREFVFGGATRTVLNHPKLPVLMSQ